MLSRRHFRVKALQAIYAFQTSETRDLLQGEKFLQSSLDKLHELYINQLSFLVELADFNRIRSDEAKNKYFPTEEEINPNMRFANNKVLLKLTENRDYQRYYEKYHINWVTELELIKRVTSEIRELKEYSDFMASPDDSWNAHQQIIMDLIRNYFALNDSLDDYYEDKNIFWSADYETSLMMAMKAVRDLTEDATDMFDLPGIFDEDPDQAREDRAFMFDLFKKTIMYSDEYELLIANALDNWELERIASMDKLLIKMALCELQHFSNIPVKVSMNEYIEISKFFSTPKSSQFINGILDKLLENMKAANKIKKRGKGLME
jgi:N utilization substance protein B